jgi:hypothetical protein
MKLNPDFNYYLFYLEKNIPQKILITINESFILERLNFSLKKIKNYFSALELCSDGSVKIINIPEKNILSLKKQKVIKEEFFG